jgi:hypothetical protein
MLFQRISRNDAEKVFAIFYNVSNDTIQAGYPAVWDISSSADGLRVSKPATASLSVVVGIAVEAVQSSQYGKFQCYGYKSSALVTNNTSVAVAAGDILIPVDAQWYLARSSAGDGKSGFLYAAEAFATATTPAAANKKVFIRAL